MAAKKSVLGVIGFLLLSTCLCFAWSGLPPQGCTHDVLTKLALVGMGVEEKTAKEIAEHADGPDFHRTKCTIGWGLCPRGGPCPIVDTNTNCSDTHGHRISEYMLNREDELGRYCGNIHVNCGRGAEKGAVYWANRARAAYLQNPKDKKWQQYLGWATHYLADALCPPHCFDPNNPDKLAFWTERITPIPIPMFDTRDAFFEGGIQIFDLHFFEGLDICMLIGSVTGLKGQALATACAVINELLPRDVWEGWLKNYREWVKNPTSIVGDDFNAADIAGWIVGKAREVANMPTNESWPYLSQENLKKVFAWISIGIRGLYNYVTAANRLPIAIIAASGPAVLVESTVTLDGRASYDPDGFPLKYEWEIISKPSGSKPRLSKANTATPSFKPDKPGDYVLQLTVTDLGNAKSRAQVTMRAVTLGLLAGTSSPGKVYVYRGGSRWEPISDDLGFAVLDLIVYDGILYAGVMSSPYGGVGRLYRYDGGTNWTLVGDNLDNQVSCLVVYKGKLYIGTSWNGGRLYRYDGPGRCVLVVNHRDPGNWYGFQSAYVWGDYLYLGDIGYDIIGRYDGTKFEHIVHLGGSCIYDFVLYNRNLYAGAWNGSLYRSSNGTTWEKVTATGLEGSHLWELEVFKNRLFMGFESGKLQSFDGRNVQTVWTAPTSIISMVTDGTQLYLGTGGEAGYKRSTSGEGRVYVYNGKSVTSISDRLGVGVQVLYLASSGAKTSPAYLEQTGEPPSSLTVKTVPNPIRDVHSTTFIVEGVNAELIWVEVYDLTGKLVWQGEGSGNELTWHTEDLTGLPLANGVYLYKVFVKVGETWIASDVQKLVILR